MGGWEGVIAFIVIWRMNAYGYSESPEIPRFRTLRDLIKPINSGTAYVLQCVLRKRHIAHLRTGLLSISNFQTHDSSDFCYRGGHACPHVHMASQPGQQTWNKGSASAYVLAPFGLSQLRQTHLKKVASSLFRV